jgi:hypothetical protein
VLEPPRPKKTPRKAVGAADLGKGKNLKGGALRISDKPKFRLEGKWLVVEWRPGIWVRLDTEGRTELPREVLT